jgi:hypothetical protein
MNSTIGPNDAVTFDSAAGKQTGKIESIRTDISNGAKLALVALTTGGTAELPVNHLKAAA